MLARIDRWRTVSDPTFLPIGGWWWTVSYRVQLASIARWPRRRLRVGRFRARFRTHGVPTRPIDVPWPSGRRSRGRADGTGGARGRHWRSGPSWSPWSTCCFASELQAVKRTEARSDGRKRTSGLFRSLTCERMDDDAVRNVPGGRSRRVHVEGMAACSVGNGCTCCDAAAGDAGCLLGCARAKVRRHVKAPCPRRRGCSGFAVVALPSRSTGTGRNTKAARASSGTLVAK